MRRLALVLGAVAGCGQPAATAPPTAPPIAPHAPADAPRTRDASPRPADASPRRIVGKLGARPPTRGAWATTVCVEGHALVFENFCGCNDALQCQVHVARPGAIDVALTLDPTRMPNCLDCFPMVPARCALGALAPGTWTVAINGARALELVVDAGGDLPDGACWSEN